MSTKRIVTVSRSDGDQDQWPTNTHKAVAPDGTLLQPHSPSPIFTGTYDYFRQVEPDEPKDLLWRRKCAEFLCQKGHHVSENVIMNELPKNYKLYEQVKFSSTSSKPRTDVYLFGHPTGRRFRSPNEFNDHLFWLACSATYDRSSCECCCCRNGGKRPRSHGKKTPPKKIDRDNAAVKERLADTRPGAPLFRLGEIAWLVAEQDDTCRPCRIVDRHLDPNISYTIADLAGLQHEQTVDQSRLVPWVSRRADSNSPNKSIQKALQISSSYSLFQKIDDEPDPKFRKFAGIYIGPDKIWVQDLVRIEAEEAGHTEELMYVTSLGVTNDNEVVLNGDVFTREKFVSGYMATRILDQKVLVEAEKLGIKWTQRNGRDASGPHVMQCHMMDVKGRWFPSTFPAVMDQPDSYQRTGNREDAFKFEHCIPLKRPPSQDLGGESGHGEKTPRIE
ncbi:Cryptic loci regulator 2 [Neolecta irregularis DAH-3]|uniref:Cryptic loci regulator 2 n=1 Tax=Neolecta irregularis (strain DAH-3) TaxID=1198029 RepID=A0A1U7LSN6_NEOID|nr:Cryptic loci regulator 2 [Neolecta irregularis DAH-3]|eukprot:OLL25531.1 Cryptic loci regulator 2 [Neolecta irregularis DAH-3]